MCRVTGKSPEPKVWFSRVRAQVAAVLNAIKYLRAKE